jgi:hypothetical protein
MEPDKRSNANRSKPSSQRRGALAPPLSGKIYERDSASRMRMVAPSLARCVAREELSRMEPELPQRASDPPSGGDAGQDVEAGGAPSAGSHPRGRVTRALDPAGEPDHEAEPPQVERSAWLKDDNFWRTETYMTATGRRPSVQAAARPLPPPRRFRAPTPLRSAMVLLLVLALMVLIPIGVVMAGREAAGHLTLPGKIPGITVPTLTPIHPNATPSATPKK